jgi:protein phosphatase
MTDPQASRFAKIRSSATAFRIEVAGLSDRGLRRSNNEDDFGFDLDCNIFVVCDGMGGMAAGEVASSIAVDHTLQAYRDLCTDDVSPQERLHCAIASANSVVWQMARNDARLRGMGTTLVAACVNGKDIVLGNVGDSRAYLLRDDACVQITEDHSCTISQELRGKDGESSSTSMRRFITRAVGAEAIVTPDFFVAKLEPGDMILLATDGLTRYLDQEKISRHIRPEDDLHETCRSLITTVYAKGAEDNVTCLLLRAD